jgi:hypothetical protein
MTKDIQIREGQFVRDTVKESVCVLVAKHGTPADQFEIDELAGTTVAGCRTNKQEWKHDPVVEVVYVESANDRLDTWAPETLVEMFEDGRLNSVPGLRTYSLPAGRIERAGQTGSGTGAIA